MPRSVATLSSSSWQVDRSRSVGQKYRRQDVPDIAPARRVDTTIVRVLAMLLIANSHLEALYPRPWLAGDGLLGNSLFYVLSGFGLAASAEARGLAGFGPWFARRLI